MIQKKRSLSLRGGLAKILVVDDSKKFQNVLSELLAPLGVQIITANNGVEGLRTLLDQFPTLVTLDQGMPKLNGFSMMKIMQLLGIKTPAVLITNSELAHSTYTDFDNLVGVCPKDQIRKRLLDIVEPALSASPRRTFSDFTYNLGPSELLDLLGKRDRRRILVVDNSLSTRRIIQKELEVTGLYEIYFANEGREGLFKAIMTRPDLIISDIEMPDLDGTAMAQILYILGHPLPIVFVSEKKNHQVLTDIRKLDGVRGFFDKDSLTSDSGKLAAKIAQILKLSDQDKTQVKESYAQVDLEKLVILDQAGILKEEP